MKYFKWLFILTSLGVILLASTEMISYLRTPESFMLGSEAMISNGGLYYKSKISFLLINAIQIILSVWAIILLLKTKRIIGFIIAVFLVLLQSLILALI
jgi:hypothetical protein